MFYEMLSFGAFYTKRWQNGRFWGFASGRRIFHNRNQQLATNKVVSIYMVLKYDVTDILINPLWIFS